MLEKLRKNREFWLIVLIIVCIGIILFGGIDYVNSLREDLSNQAVQNVLTVTKQQQQAFDNFISQDRERLYSFAQYFEQKDSGDMEEIRRQLTFFGGVDAFYSVINLDTGRFCSNKYDEIFTMGKRELSSYQVLSGSGVREPYMGLYTDETMFGYYECFAFADGAPGLLQKSYDRSKVSETFSLSFYNDQGFAYVVNRKGDILLRSSGMDEGSQYNNIFDMFTEPSGRQQEIDDFVKALEEREMGSIRFSREAGDFVCTYVSVENVDGWFLVSIVPWDVITEEAVQILLHSQQVFLLLLVLLVISAALIMLIWYIQKNISEKNREIEYQEQLFDIFSTYLTENTGDVYMMVDGETREVEYVSPNLERVLGVSRDDIMSTLKDLGGIMRSGGGEIDFDNLQDLEPGISLETSVNELINPRTGKHKWFQESVYCALVQNRRKIIVYISDRTREREIQDTLTEALKMAQVANKAKSSFLSSVSHDIRTPMNAIIGFVSLLQEKAENPGLVREYAKQIDAASQHLLGLINDVLDMNKIESGSATLNNSEMSLVDIIDEINSIIRPQAKAKSQNFAIFASSIVNEHLQGDKLRINQILINLLSNAVKYTPKGGNIQMRVEEMPQVVEDYSRIRFTISDNGLGMSEEYQKVMFDPFTREDTEIIRQIQGTGLGMAITKSLVDLLGGTIQVQSKPGEGTVFTVELELFIQAREDDPRFWADHHVEKMLVADDDEEVCLNIAGVMKKNNVQTDYSVDGRTVVEMMRAAREDGHPYDLVLLDWKMPELDGLETARLIRENYPEKIPILLFTAYDWGEIEQEAAEIGIHHFMPKPFFVSTLKEAVGRIMGGIEAERGEERSSVVEGKHILVVDDIEINRIVLVKILGTLGASCDVAGNGQEALEKFEASSPGEYDLIFMDVQMPVMDGYAATRAIRASAHPSAGTIPIIAMTANAFVDDVRDAIESGMDAHIAKPVQLDKLKATVRQVFDSRKQEREG